MPRLARETGVKVMLAGDGGDELFGGNERYAKEVAVDRYQALPAILRRGLIEPLAFHAPGGERIALLRKAGNHVRRASLPLPDRWACYERFDGRRLGEVFSPDVAAEADPMEPLQVMRAAFERPAEASDLKRLMHLDLQLALADNDLRKVNRACEMAGVEVLYPLLDEAIVDFSAALPSPFLVRGGKLRYFYKRALTHYLPRVVIEKPKHGFGVPFVEAITSFAPLRELAYDAASAARARGVMNRAFLDRTLESHRRGDDSQAGNLLWSIMMLELWLARHLDEGRGPGS